MRELTTSQPAPEVPDHHLVRCIGRGSYGEVWLARSTLGTLRAVKVVFRSNFEEERPYEREYNGIRKYEPVSRSHEGLVDILQVGRNDSEGCFYYVMELADAAPGSGLHPPQEAGQLEAGYSPMTFRAIQRQGRMPVDEVIAGWGSRFPERSTGTGITVWGPCVKARARWVRAIPGRDGQVRSPVFELPLARRSKD